MPVYSRDSKLSDVILYDPSVIQVVNRFGIYLGVGDSSIKTICEEHNIEETLFLSIVNTYLNRNYFPEGTAGKVSLHLLIDYLEKTDYYYSSILLPNIERHFNLLISKSITNEEPTNLQLLQKFFIEVKAELLGVIETDLTHWFPALRGNKKIGSMEKECSENRKPYDNHVLEEKISDLINFFVIHLRGVYDHNLCVAVVSALVTLEKDIQQNNRIRDRILKPLCQE
ncbi:MAG: helix-turn-helix transcriptional regulator [Muribaculaceae bacterium]|nr:helix-turn-helix transcriptional regulator [Muribaculaceae bacterium]